jgi:hypothetical protein
MLNGLQLSAFTADLCIYLHISAVQHLKLQNIYTKHRKTLIFTNNAVAICTAARHNLPYLSVPDTRTTFTYFWSLNRKCKPDGNVVLNNTTSALDTGEFLGSGLNPLFRGEDV